MLDSRTWTAVFHFAVQTIEALQKQFDDQATDEQKKQEVLEALHAAYDAADKFLGLPGVVDAFVKGQVIPVILDGSLVAAEKFGWYHPEKAN